MVAVLIFLILEKIQNSFPKINMVGALCIISLKKKKLPTWTEKMHFIFKVKSLDFVLSGAILELYSISTKLSRVI